MDGLLQTNQSYNFEPEKLGTYKANRIEPAKFSDWQKDHMYKSSYAHFHSRVLHHSNLGFSRTKSIVNSKIWWIYSIRTT